MIEWHGNMSQTSNVSLSLVSISLPAHRDSPLRSPLKAWHVTGLIPKSCFSAMFSFVCCCLVYWKKEITRIVFGQNVLSWYTVTTASSTCANSFLPFEGHNQLDDCTFTGKCRQNVYMKITIYSITLLFPTNKEGSASLWLINFWVPAFRSIDVERGVTHVLRRRKASDLYTNPSTNVLWFNRKKSNLHTRWCD
jgi:hypothetical protein